MDNAAYIDDGSSELGYTKDVKSMQHAHTFEEAISLTGVGKFHYLLLLICGLCYMSVMVEIMGVSIIMPSMKCDMPATLSEMGMLASAGFLGVVSSSHAMGFLSDTWGRVRSLRCSLVLSITATIISALSVNIWMLIVFRFLNGFFISGCQACVFSLCGEFHSNKTRVRHVSLLAGFLPFALIYLPTMAILILPLRFDFLLFGMAFSSWRLLLIINSLLSIIALIGFFALPETPKYVLVQGDHDGALEILRTVYEKNTGRSRDDYPVKSIVLETVGASLTNIHSVKDALRMIWSQTIPLFYKERCLHTINICIFMFVVSGVAQGFFMWFPTILNEMLAKEGLGLEICQIIDNMELKANTRVADNCTETLDVFMFQVLIVMGGVFTLIYLIFAFTIDLVGKKNLLLIWLSIAGVCTLSVHWISQFVLAMIALSLTMSVGNCSGIISTIAMEFFPTNINAMGMCFIMMMARLGAVAGSNIIGLVLFDNCDLVFWTILGTVVMLCIMGVFLPEKKRVKEIKINKNNAH